MHKKIFIGIAFLMAMILAQPVTEAWALLWRDDLNSALNEADQTNKPIMVDFYTTWCHWCKELDRNTYSDGKVIALSAKFICVKVDAEKNTAAAGKYNVRGYPTVVFLNPDGSVHSRITGYRPPEIFVQTMESVLQQSRTITKKVNRGLELNGVIMNNQKKLVAIINNAFVKEGDVIDGGRVSKISKDNVEIAFDDKIVTLKIDQL